VLPTLGFILCAYGIYALIRVWSRLHRRQGRVSSRLWRGGRLGLIGATGLGLGFIILISFLGLPSRYDNISAASIISASWGHESWGAVPARTLQEYLPLKNQGDPGRPVYAYLHPETPPPQLLPEEKSASRTLHKPKFIKPRSHAKGFKAVHRASKKGKVLSKTRFRKKKSHR
jgi:hypothetical protein